MKEARLLLEQKVACCLMMEPQNAARLDISADDFLYPPARAVVASISELQSFDVAFVLQYAVSHGLNVLASQVSAMLILPTAANFELYLSQLKKQIITDSKAILRLNAKKKIEQGDDPQLIAENLAAQESVLENKYGLKAESGSILEAAADYLEGIEKGRDNGPLLATRWDDFDRLHAGGLLPNELVIIAARPSCGKTAAALQICLHCGEKVVLFSLEMSKRQLVARLLAAIAKENTKTASRKPSALPISIKERLLEAGPLLCAACQNITVHDESDQTITTIRRNARKAVADGAKLVIIDYLQLINGTNSRKDATREREVAEISRALKNMSKELNVPVIVLAQLNRSCEAENRVPRLSDLRESGSIEQDANSVLFLHDTSKKDTRGYKIISLILAKGRDVGVGYTNAIFNADYQTFEPAPREI